METDTVTFSIDVHDGDTSDVVIDLLWSHGVQAVEEIGVSPHGVELRSSFGLDATATERRLSEIFADSGLSLNWRLAVIDHRVTDTWKKHVGVVEVSPGIRVVPAWLDGVDARSTGIDIRIDPGATFGMGDHPTTRGCLDLMTRFVRAEDRVLDVGCGSGILGIGALLFGAGSAHGIDINPAAVEVSLLNAQRNSVEDRWSVAVDGLDDLGGTYDIITANILAPVLIELAREFTRLSEPGGTLVIGGLLESAHHHVLDALASFVVIDSVVIDGWISLALQR